MTRSLTEQQAMRQCSHDWALHASTSQTMCYRCRRCGAFGWRHVRAMLTRRAKVRMYADQEAARVRFADDLTAQPRTLWGGRVDPYPGAE